MVQGSREHTVHVRLHLNNKGNKLIRSNVHVHVLVHVHLHVFAF